MHGPIIYTEKAAEKQDLGRVAQGKDVLFLQAGKSGKQKSNAAALHTIPWTGEQPGLGSGKSVIYSLKSESPNRKITGCQCK